MISYWNRDGFFQIGSLGAMVSPKSEVRCMPCILSGATAKM